MSHTMRAWSSSTSSPGWLSWIRPIRRPVMQEQSSITTADVERIRPFGITSPTTGFS